MRVERIGEATLYLGRCEDIVPTLTRPAALIGDPPYGQRHKTNIFNANRVKTYRCGVEGGGERVIAANRRNRTPGGFSGNIASPIWPAAIEGDDAEFDPTPWLDAADTVLLWGAHKFADRLPTGSWLVWDKVPTGKLRDQGDGEAAWINDDPPRPMRIHRLLWDGVCVGSAARHEVTAGQSRVHPTQKPISLMSWCIEQARVPSGGVILDPWMGAGSTGVAALQRGHPFIGIECEPLYFETALLRIEQAYRQRDLFIHAPVAAAAPEDDRIADLFMEPEP